MCNYRDRNRPPRTLPIFDEKQHPMTVTFALLPPPPLSLLLFLSPAICVVSVCITFFTGLGIVIPLSRTIVPRHLLLTLQRDEVPAHYGDFTPDHKVIYKFIKTLFHAAQVRSASHTCTCVCYNTSSHFPTLYIAHS